jgi:RNA polymerase sigma factor (sigma-70 family)
MNRNNFIQDQILIENYKKTRDRSCFDQLYSRHINIVFRKCLSYLRNPEEAEDASQEIWIKVYFSLEKFEQRSSFSTWLYRITINHCINQLKKRKFFVSLDELSEAGFDIEDKNEDFFVTLSNMDQVTKALSLLSKDMKAILLMKYMDEYTYKEIAQITGLSESAIKMRIARAKQQLKINFSKSDEQ